MVVFRVSIPPVLGLLMVSLDSTPLFAPELVQRFERLEAVWGEICRFRNQSRALQQKLRAPELIDQQLHELRGKLSRERFRVGFLGTSQAGKSTTLNNYIDQRGLLPEGDGRSCTSIRVRFFATPPSLGYQVRFTFLTRNAFRHRRDDLACGRLNLFDRDGDQQYNDEDVLDKLNAANIPEDDKHFEVLLRKLIEAGRAHPTLLSETSQPHVVDAQPTPQNDDDVKRLLKRTATHGGDSDLKYVLLDEIQLGVPGLALPAKLELVDLPGLGTARAADSDYTMRAVRELDAAIVAINFGGNLDVPENYQLVKELREIFDRDARRVWIVGTKLDAVERDRLWGNHDKDFPRMLASVLTQHQLNFAQVSFVANVWFNKEDPTEKHVAITHGMKYGAEGEALLPPTFDDYPEFAAAYKRFSRDGGIQALKEIINGTMVAAITEGLSKQIENTMRRVVNDLSIAVQTARDSAALGASGRTLVRRWRTAIDRVLHGLKEEAQSGGDENPLRQMAVAVRRDMHEQLGVCLEYTRSDESGVELAHRFQDASEEMYQLAINSFGPHSKLAEQYFASVTQRLQHASTGIDVPAGIASPLETLQAKLQSGFDASQQRRLVFDIESLKSRTLIDGSRGLPFGIREFRTIMEKKIDQVVRQTEYRFQNFVRIQLDTIAAALFDLTPAEEQEENFDVAVYKKWLTDLANLLAPANTAPAKVELPPSANGDATRAAARPSASEPPRPASLGSASPQSASAASASPVAAPAPEAAVPPAATPPSPPPASAAPPSAAPVPAPPPPTASHPNRPSVAAPSPRSDPPATQPLRPGREGSEPRNRDKY